MDARVGLQGRGFNLVLKLYLLLAAIFLPTFALYYVYSQRVVDDLREKEVDKEVDRVTLRLQTLLANYNLGAIVEGDIFPSEDKAKKEAERKEIERLLQNLLADLPAMDGVSVFAAGREPGLVLVVGCGSSSTRASMEDVDVYTHSRTRRSSSDGKEGSVLTVSAPLLRWNAQASQDEAVGAVRMQFSPARMTTAGKDAKSILLIGAAGIMLLIGIGLPIFFHYAVRRPALELVDAMKRASEGNLSALVEPRTGEMGWLAASYNQMMRRLKQSIDENDRLIKRIQGSSEDLKKQVEEATRELAATNEKLFLLQRQMTTLEKLATLGQLATTIAHELGTPLNAISGHLQLLAEEEVGERARERVKVIDAQVDRLVGIVRDVLKSMRVPPPRLEPMDANRVIEDVLALVAPVVRKRNIAVERRLSRDLPTVRGDADQMEQVLMNLLTNAMDAMIGGGTLGLATSFVPAEEAAKLSEAWSAPAEGSYLRIDVSDTGVGMDEETARRVFEPFFSTKGTNATNEEEGGVGLGLAICRQIVKGHQGEVTVHSEAGKGTTFSLFLPVSRERVLVG